jgi:hypothetical protein
MKEKAKKKNGKQMGLEKFALRTRCNSPSTKAPIGKIIQTLVCHEPHAQKFTPHHLTYTHEWDRLHLGNTLALGVINPIGHLETLPKSRFGKLYNVLEHLFNLRGCYIHMFGCFDY